LPLLDLDRQPTVSGGHIKFLNENAPVGANLADLDDIVAELRNFLTRSIAVAILGSQVS